MDDSTTHISEAIVGLYNTCALLLAAPQGSLTHWEEELLCNFIVMYWSDDVMQVSEAKPSP